MLIKTFRRLMGGHADIKTVTIKKQIELQQRNVEYTLKISHRAKRVRLAIYCDGNFVVTTPKRVTFRTVERFMIRKARWILDKLDYFRSFPQKNIRQDTRIPYLENRERARLLAERKVGEFNQSYRYKFNNISIKNQKTRWGSCSRKGNLNFNYKIALLPERLCDYIIVHELCHLGAFNHSRKFWDLVSKTIPEYKQLRKELRKKSLELSA